ncbi:hypothetical protein D3Y55_19520 [Mesorhizobium sp. DCY119]|nr:hypothetical protein D3Y55_19520 [Mesorhizobium sp. DCY119]
MTQRGVVLAAAHTAVLQEGAVVQAVASVPNRTSLDAEIDNVLDELRDLFDFHDIHFRLRG